MFSPTYQIVADKWKLSHEHISYNFNDYTPYAYFRDSAGVGSSYASGLFIFILFILLLFFFKYKLIKTLCIHKIDLRHTKQKPRTLEQKQHWNKIISEERLKELLKND